MRPARAEVVALLGRAKVELAKALPKLDRRTSACGGCGLVKKADWTEHQAAEEIEAMIRKLEKWQASLTKE